MLREWRPAQRSQQDQVLTTDLQTPTWPVFGLRSGNDQQCNRLDAAGFGTAGICRLLEEEYLSWLQWQLIKQLRKKCSDR
jgi:hypothetical protein